MPKYPVNAPSYLGAASVASICREAADVGRSSAADASQGFVRGLFGLVLWELILTSWFEVRACRNQKRCER
jgi:hypothetical protein